MGETGRPESVTHLNEGGAKVRTSNIQIVHKEGAGADTFNYRINEKVEVHACPLCWWVNYCKLYFCCQ